MKKMGKRELQQGPGLMPALFLLMKKLLSYLYSLILTCCSKLVTFLRFEVLGFISIGFEVFRLLVIPQRRGVEIQLFKPENFKPDKYKTVYSPLCSVFQEKKTELPKRACPREGSNLLKAISKLKPDQHKITPILFFINRILKTKKSLLKAACFFSNALQEVCSFLRNRGKTFLGMIFLIYLSFSLVSCLLPPPFPSPSEVQQRSEAEDAARGRSRERSQDAVSDKRCSESSDCPDICEKIFERRTERDECEDRSVSEVKEFERISNFFKGKDAKGSSVSDDAEYFGNLSRIGEEDLDDFVSISENLAELFDDYNDIFHEPTFRNWIADNSGIAEIFKDADENFEVFEELFGSGCVHSALTSYGYVERKPDSDGGEPGGAQKPPDEVAIEAGNRDFLQWVHDYLRNEGYSPPDPRDLIDDNDPPDNWCS